PPSEEILGERDRLGRLDRLDRRAGGDASEQRHRHRAPGSAVGYQLERPAVVREPADASLPFEVLQVLVDGRERREREVPPDLLERRRVPVVIDVLPQVLEQLLLPPRNHPGARIISEETAKNKSAGTFREQALPRRRRWPTTTAQSAARRWRCVRSFS